MKKVLCIVMILSFLFCAASCGVNRSESGETLSETETTSIPTNETTDISIFASYDSYAALGLSSLAEYEEHFSKQGGYPEGFISYDDLKAFGEFDGFVSQSYYGNDPNYSYYYYKILYSSGAHFYVDIHPEWRPSAQFTWDMISVKNTMIESDLRTNQTDEIRGSVLIGDTLYTYLVGKLHEIEWRSGGLLIAISGDFDQIPEVSTDSLLGRLLNYNTAEAALAELRETTKSGFCTYQDIYSFAEYQKVTASGYPKGFISYDDLKWLGEFEGLVSTGKYFVYFIHHPSGVDFTVHIYPKDEVEIETEWILRTESVKNTIPGSNLRTNNTTNDLGTVLIGDVMYIYRSGKLNTIQWEHSEKIIRISGDFHKLPDEMEDSVLEKILDNTRAESAVLEMQKMIKAS